MLNVSWVLEQTGGTEGEPWKTRLRKLVGTDSTGALAAWLPSLKSPFPPSESGQPALGFGACPGTC